MSDQQQPVQFKYDLFVSYAPDDRGWVNGYLLDALRSAQIKVISEADFELGAPRLAEFERAVQQSARTLLVLTPAAVTETFSQFVAILVQSYGLESGTWPVIPLLLKPVELPPRLALLTPLDVTELEYWPAAIERLCANVQKAPPVPPARPPCPYPGMRAFGEKEASAFHGRDAEIEDLLQRLRRHPFAAVVGASGSGKSSLVFAGLIPALRRSGLFGEGEWLVRSLRPGDHPLAALQSSLGVEDAGQLIPATLLATEKAARLLLVVDQFEEVFTQGAAGREAFFAAIQHITSLRDCFVVLTVRADFFDDLLTSALWPLIQPHRLEIAPLGAAGLRAAIVKPAEDVGVFIESALVERLVASSVGQPGLLPFVQEVMVRLWEKLERRYLPLRAYEALVLPLAGYSDNERESIIRAIALLADEIIHRFSPQQQSIARRILLRLVQFGEGRDDTRRQQPVSALRAAGDDAAVFDRTLNYLAENRLLVLSGTEDSEPRVDLAHEAMLTGWPMLQGWVKQGKEAEVTRRRLEDRAAEWVRLGADKSGLLDEIELADITVWLASADARGLGISPSLHRFIAQSEGAARQRRSTRKLRKIAIVGLPALTLLVVVAIIGNWTYTRWLNRAWQDVGNAPQVSFRSLAANDVVIAIGSYDYGVAEYIPDVGWSEWMTDGLPIGQQAIETNDPGAHFDAILALAYDQQGNQLFALVEGEGVFRYSRDADLWTQVNKDLPKVSEANTPLAAHGGIVLYIADDLGLYVSEDGGGTWMHLDQAPLFDQPLRAATFDSSGAPLVAGERGILRGEGAFPYQWTQVGDPMSVRLLAADAGGWLYAAINEDGQSFVVCLNHDGDRISPQIPLKVSSWLAQPVIPVAPDSLAAHPHDSGRMFMVDTQAGIYDMRCSGEIQQIGQFNYLATGQNQIVTKEVSSQQLALLLANAQGLKELMLR
jgi:hypothetical protein